MRVFTLFLAVIMLPLTPITTIGSGSYRGVRLFFRSCLHGKVSPALIFIMAVCLLSAYCFIFYFCFLARWRIIMSSECLGSPLTSGNFPCSSHLNMSLFGLTPVVACSVALYVLTSLHTQSLPGLPSNAAIRAVLCITLHKSFHAAGGLDASGCHFQALESLLLRVFFKFMAVEHRGTLNSSLLKQPAWRRDLFSLLHAEKGRLPTSIANRVPGSI